jgi:hypothetical protein
MLFQQNVLFHFVNLLLQVLYGSYSAFIFRLFELLYESRIVNILCAHKTRSCASNSGNYDILIGSCIKQTENCNHFFDSSEKLDGVCCVSFGNVSVITPQDCEGQCWCFYQVFH